MMAPNIVQAEFFHVGGKNIRSLKSLFQECDERVSEGIELALKGIESRSRIKTVVRFFDESGELTRLVLNAEDLHEKRKQVFKSFVGAKALRRWWLSHQSRRLTRKILVLKQKGRIRAAESLRNAIYRSREVAVECSDHSFRHVRNDEACELIEAARNSKYV